MSLVVTGVAGDIGDGIGRVLRRARWPDRLVGCDIHSNHLGERVFDEVRVLPRADDPEYIEALTSVAREAGATALIPTSEPELRLLTERGFDDDVSGIPLIAANLFSRRVGFDKLRTARFLEETGLPYPWTRSVSEDDPKALPCIVKSRFGAGSQQVSMVENSDAVRAHRVLNPDYIWQELVGTAADEYTCGVFRSRHGETRSIVLKRRLNAGVTVAGEVVESPEIDSLCRGIAAGLALRGSINVQLRLTPRGPMVFEINPRFSSTVVFRDVLGFADVLWSLADRLQGEPSPYSPPARAGTRFFRRHEEIVVDE